MKRQVLRLSENQVLAAIAMVLTKTDFQNACIADISYEIARELGFKL